MSILVVQKTMAYHQTKRQLHVIAYVKHNICNHSCSGQLLTFAFECTIILYLWLHPHVVYVYIVSSSQYFTL